MSYYNSKPRKKLVEQLKPSTNGGGKVVECPRCYGPAEHVSTTIATCPRCDKPRARRETPPVVFEYLDGPNEFDDEPTQPGIGSMQWTVAPTPSNARWFRCGSCPIQTKVDMDLVAAGYRCTCGGTLYVQP